MNETSESHAGTSRFRWRPYFLPPLVVCDATFQVIRRFAGTSLHARGTWGDVAGDLFVGVSIFGLFRTVEVRVSPGRFAELLEYVEMALYVLLFGLGRHLVDVMWM